jgi:hypothetical protein
MENLHGFLHGILYIMCHGMLEFALGPPPRGRHDAKLWQTMSVARPSNENQGPSQIHGHNLWFIHEVVLKGDSNTP